MKNFIIIIIYRACMLRIHLLTWYLLPAWTDDSSLGNKTKWITIKYPGNAGIPYEIKNYKYAYRTGILISFLCCTLQFTRWKYVRELQTIYGDDYDCNTDPEWQKKYEQLCATDYFN